MSESTRSFDNKSLHHKEYPSAHSLLEKGTLGKVAASRIGQSSLSISLVYRKIFQRAELKGLNVEISEHSETMKREKKSSPNHRQSGV